MKVSEMPYQRISQEEVLSYLQECEEKLHNAKNAQAQKQIYDEAQEYFENVMTMSSLAYIRFSQDTRDKFYGDEQDYYDSIMPLIGARSTELGNLLLDSPFLKELEKLYPPVFFRNLEIARKANDRKIVSLTVQENQLVTEYTKRMSGITVPFRGEILPPSGLRKYFTSGDRSVRKEAMEALGTEYLKIAEATDDVFDRMVKVRTEMAQTLGYESFVTLGDLRMGRNCYTREDLARLRENVQQYLVPLVCELREKINPALGIDRTMLYDNDVFSQTEPKPIGTVEEIFQNGVKMYEELNEKTGELIRRMIDCEAFDVLSREGKWGGGYCTELPKYRLPFILANFNGSSGDIEVLTHEFGHALAFDQAYAIENPALRGTTMETAEVHSMSMEFFTHPWMELFFGKNASIYRFCHIASAVTFLPYGTMVDAFQEEVYLHPEMTPDKRLELWKNLEKTFRPYLSQEGLPFFGQGRAWQKQAHIFESPFYYIDYVIAQLTAFEFLGQMRKDFDGTFRRYMAFLQQGGTKTYTELLQSVGMPSPFEKEAFCDIVATIRTELGL